MRLRFLAPLFATTFVANVAFAADFYVDPETGSPDGDGSAERPWRTIEEVLGADLVETRNWASLPYAEGTPLVAVNEGAPIHAGDRVLLRSGYHGELMIEGAYNETPITIEAEPGHTPRVRNVHLRAAGGWVIRGLSISPSHAPTFEQITIVDIESHNFRGPSFEDVIEGCQVFADEDSSAWTADDWIARAPTGISVDGDRCVVRDNVLRNVRFGIVVGGRDARIERNVIDGFCADGLRGLGDGGVFEGNVVENLYDVDDNHDDGFQSWSVGADGMVGTGEVRGIVLRGNTFINYERADRPLLGALQGIGCFDGFFVDWIVENNVVITDHWHGITLLGARDSRVVNNTVLDPNDVDPGPPWISIGEHKDGRPSERVVVRNNLVTDLQIDESGIDVVEDHNLVVGSGDLAALFVAPRYDVHLLPGSAAVDTGSAEGAPPTDIEGVPRPQGGGVDVGAYEWHDGPPVTPDAGPSMDAGMPSGDDGGGGPIDRDGATTPPPPGAMDAARDARTGSGGDGATGAGSSSSDDGCGCRVAGAHGAPRVALGLGVASGLFAMAMRRRRRRR